MPPQDQDRIYFERRQRESAERAATVEDPSIARVHQQFADHYTKRLRALPDRA